MHRSDRCHGPVVCMLVRHLVQVLSNLGLITTRVIVLVCSNSLVTTADSSQHAQQVRQFLLPQLFSQFHIQVLHFVVLRLTGSRFRVLSGPMYNLVLFVHVSIPAPLYCAFQSPDRKHPAGTVLALTNFIYQCLNANSFIPRQQKCPGCASIDGGTRDPQGDCMREALRSKRYISKRSGADTSV